MHWPFEGKMLAEPKGSLKKFANRKYYVVLAIPF